MLSVGCGCRQALYLSWSSRRRRIVDFTVALFTEWSDQAPPAYVTWHGPLHFQMPTALRLMENLPHAAQKCLECCDVSIFFTRFLRFAPYLWVWVLRGWCAVPSSEA